MAKTETGSGPATFEEAFRRLQEIVARMESGDLALEDLLERYEEGVRLVKFCSDKLSSRLRNPESPLGCRIVAKRSRRPVKSLWT